MAARLYPDTVFHPRCVLGVDGDGNFRVVSVDATGQLQVDVLGSALPDGAAEQASLNSVDNKLNQVSGLRDALVTRNMNGLIAAIVTGGGAAHDMLGHTDGQPIVRGQDQLFSYESQYIEEVENLNGATGFNYLTGAAVDPGVVRVVTSMGIYNNNHEMTSSRLGVRKGGTDYWAALAGASGGAAIGARWSGTIIMVEGDQLRGAMSGVVLNDDLYLFGFGYNMTLET